MRTIAYELVLLDLMLPDGRGLDFLKAHRTSGDATPVIILTARDQVSDRIAGLNAGADDYLVKPFDLSELSARMGAVARRYAGNPNPHVEIADLTIDLATWKPHSDLNRLNAAPLGAWVPLPRELMRVLAKSLEIGRITKGAFDIGVGDLVAAWGFGAPGLWPDRSGVADRPRPVTTTALLLNERAGVACKTAALCLDLSGIAKGFGVDEMARVMDAFAVPAWLVGIDGEMRAKGVKPDGEPWAVAHERPDRSIREAMGVIELHDMAVATSGNYRHWIELDGRIVSHTMSTTTSAPLDDTIASVTLMAPTCMEADAFATAFMVLGVEEGMRMATARGIEAIFVLKDGSVVLAEAPVLP